MEAKVHSEIKYFVFYKPYNVLNQFTKERPEHVTLADFLKVEKDIYPVGRLDKDSEGLIILTNDSMLNNLLLSPGFAHSRTYFVQVDNDITQKAIDQVASGVDIKLETSIYRTKPCEVKKLPKEPALPDRNPPVRFRQNIPTSWVKIELKEGKNRQIRKMFAKVGFPVLRLIRIQIEDLRIGKLEPGEYIEMEQKEIFKLLKINADQKSISKGREKVKKGSDEKSDKSSAEKISKSKSDPSKPNRKVYSGKSAPGSKDGKAYPPKRARK